MALETRSSRRFWTGAILVVLAAAAVFARRGFARPWRPECPSFRQSGRADAPVVLVEFSDFQCPGCAGAFNVMRQIKGAFGDQVHVYYKYLLWTRVHRWAKDAALSADCAGKQGRFWDMHDLLFSRQADWSASGEAPKIFGGYAKELGLDLNSWEACKKDPLTASAIEADAQDAKDHWINSTPTFFINGRRLVGARQLQIFGLPLIQKKASS